MNYLSPEVVVGNPDTIENRALPDDVTEMIQNSSTSVSSDVLPAEVTDAQRAAAEEYAATTSPTERATILGTTGLTNDQLLSIALDNDGTTSPDAPMGNVANNGASVPGGTGSVPSVSSPLPSTSGGNGASTGNGNTTSSTTNSNRTDVNASGAKPSGLYIPTKADTGLSDMSVTNLIRNLMNWLLYIVGFLAIIAFVISGIQYLLAGASEEMAKQAKANMQYAMIGVVVALSALIIIRAVQSVLSGAWIF
jgi:hypothetical protein